MCHYDYFKGRTSKWCGFDFQNPEQRSLNTVSQPFAYFMGSFIINPNFRNLSRETFNAVKLWRLSDLGTDFLFWSMTTCFKDL